VAEQIKIVNLNCANCGGILEVHGDMDQFACGYCGSVQIVERRGGTVALRLVVDAVARVQVGTDRTAAELALVRLEKELATVHAKLQAARMNFGPISRFFKFAAAKRLEFEAPYAQRIQELEQLIKKNREMVADS
jgi:ribosomal protein S27AE